MNESKELSQHILPTSAQLLGVCMTVISLVKALHIGHAGLIDKFLAVDALLFTVSAALSYSAMRKTMSDKFERIADQLFMVGLFELGGCAIQLAFEII